MNAIKCIEPDIDIVGMGFILYLLFSASGIKDGKDSRI